MFHCQTIQDQIQHNHLYIEYNYLLYIQDHYFITIQDIHQGQNSICTLFFQYNLLVEACCFKI